MFSNISSLRDLSSTKTTTHTVELAKKKKKERTPYREERDNHQRIRFANLEGSSFSLQGPLWAWSREKKKDQIWRKEKWSVVSSSFSLGFLLRNSSLKDLSSFIDLKYYRLEMLFYKYVCKTCHLTKLLEKSS